MMEMRTTTILIALTMLTTGLAGCTGGDPDGGGNDEFDAETLQGMIEAGLQDFINNTTVEITNNYYTNSTNQYNVNGSSGVSNLHTMVGTNSGVSIIEGDGLADVALLVRGVAYDDDLGALGLDGILICVGIGSLLEGVINDYFEMNGMTYTTINSPNFNSAVDNYIAGGCQSIVGERSSLEALDNATNISHSWITTESIGLVPGDSLGSSMLQLTIHQDSGYAIFFHSIYATVKLVGTCPNCSSDDYDFEKTYVINQMTGDYNWIFGMEYYTGGVSTCEYDLSATFANQYNELFGPGLECDHVITLNVQYTDLLPESPGEFELHWTDWTYYLHWVSTPVTVE